MSQSVCMLHHPIQLSAVGIGVFPSVKNARVIWAGIRGHTDLLENLAVQLNKALNEQLGLKLEKRRFSPHLTLVRVKQKIAPAKMVQLLEKFTEDQSDKFFVSDLNLFKSELKANGAIHSKIFSVPIIK